MKDKLMVVGYILFILCIGSLGMTQFNKNSKMQEQVDFMYQYQLKQSNDCGSIQRVRECSYEHSCG